MRSLIFKFIVITGLVSLAACASNSSTPSADAPEAASPEAATSPATEAPAASPEVATAPETDHSAPAYGGQVVETGTYHMEFVPVPEADGVHLDFYLQTGDDHAAIADAQVTAQVQLPDGSQQELPMEYDAAGEHYFAFLPAQATGEYKVVVLTDVKGEKANGRFSFTK
ncbi:MAG: hypothetical protein Kow00121_13340 [Elainellaceae cyanobacterium]